MKKADLLIGRKVEVRRATQGYEASDTWNTEDCVIVKVDVKDRRKGRYYTYRGTDADVVSEVTIPLLGTSTLVTGTYQIPLTDGDQVLVGHLDPQDSTKFDWFKVYRKAQIVPAGTKKATEEQCARYEEERREAVKAANTEIKDKLVYVQSILPESVVSAVLSEYDVRTIKQASSDRYVGADTRSVVEAMYFTLRYVNQGETPELDDELD